MQIQFLKKSRVKSWIKQLESTWRSTQRPGANLIAHFRGYFTLAPVPQFYSVIINYRWSEQFSFFSFDQPVQQLTEFATVRNDHWSLTSSIAKVTARAVICVFT